MKKLTASLLVIISLFACNSKDEEYVFPYTGNYQGTYSGDDNGTWKSTISTDGKFTGTATSNLAPNYPFTINGTVSNTGVIEAKYSYLSYTASFKGQITGSEASGTWKTDTLNLGGTWSGKKQ